MRRLLAEALGTFALVFAGTGAIACDSITQQLGHVGVAIAWGLAVLTIIAAFGDVSGAHINPAVTIGFTLARHMRPGVAILYIVAQCGGAIAASFCLSALMPRAATLGVTLPAYISPLQCFILEVLLTVGLMVVILGVTFGTKEQGLLAGLSIGGTVALEAMFAGPLTGASMNPARSLGPALAAGKYLHLWIYLLAPVLGAALAVLVNLLLRQRGLVNPAAATTKQSPAGR